MIQNKANELESATIDWLRFPLAVAVVYIHNFGSSVFDLKSIYSNPTSAESIYNFIRIFISNIGTHFAVPTFFMFSGFLFFYNIKEWNVNVYRLKLLKRFKSLFIPYVLWIAIYIAFLEMRVLAGIIIHGRSFMGLLDWIKDNGGIRMFWDSIVFGPYSNAPILIPLWFVRDLMVTILFSFVVYYLVKKFKVCILIILAALDLSNVFIPVHGFSSTCFFWFSLGAYFSIHKKNMIVCIWKYRISAYIITTSTIFPLIWLYGEKGDSTTMNHVFSILHQIYIYSAVISVVSLTSWLLKKHIVRKKEILSKASFFIFVFHIFILRYIKLLLDEITPDANYFLLCVSYLISPIITVSICLLIFELMSKYMNRVLSILVGNRK